jgi:cyclophilin family peptidyl-prolyl cis-trans isomerase
MMLLAQRARAQASLTAADTALIGRILLAEDRRDSMDAALARGAAHPNARISMMARRALHRIRDTTFAARDSFPLPPSPTWPEPAWKERFRALLPARDDCAALRRGAMDEVWQVRLRAAAVARASCATDDTLVAAFRSWVDALPADASRRRAGTVSWHGAAYGIVALARLRPADAKARMPRVATHRQWQVRMYAARAAAAMSDTGVLRALATDQEPNVQEVAIEGLSRLIGHAGDEIYASILDDDDLASVRAAAIALKGTPLASARAAALAAFERWARNNNASQRDVRVALLEAAGKTAADDRPPPLSHRLSPGTVALALGDDVRLRVTMAQPEGGASFVVRLRGDVAPMMASRIRELANAGMYDGQQWHRVADDFVVQGGWPGANEYTGHMSFFREELGLSNRRGTVGMSTRGHDTGDAQWFFNLRDNLRLDPNFTVWAEVVEGIEVMDAIMEGDRIASIREIVR